MMAACVHRWLLHEMHRANGAVPARCRRCGAEREFHPRILDGAERASAWSEAFKQGFVRDPAAPARREQFAGTGRDIYA